MISDPTYSATPNDVIYKATLTGLWPGVQITINAALINMGKYNAIMIDPGDPGDPGDPDADPPIPPTPPTPPTYAGYSPPDVEFNFIDILTNDVEVQYRPGKIPYNVDR